MVTGCSSSAESRHLHDALAVFCTEFVRGDLPFEQPDLFCGARLIHLAQKPSGTGPFAVKLFAGWQLAAKYLVEKYQGTNLEPAARRACR